MKKSIFISLLIIFVISCGLSGGTKYHFPQVGWSVTIPGGMENMTSQINEYMKRMAKDTSYSSFKEFLPKTLFMAGKKDTSSLSGFKYLFTATLLVYDWDSTSDFTRYIQRQKDNSYNSYKMMQLAIPTLKADTLSTPLKIDGLDFDKFHMTVSQDGKVTNIVELFKYYKGYNFTISYIYSDEKIKDLIESSLEKSTFSK